MTSEQPTYAAVEAGGTKFRAAVFGASNDPIAEVRIDTTTADETLDAVIAFFADHPPVASLGIASFGPLVVDRSSPNYGSIAATPKPGWSGVALLDRLQAALDVPAAIQTDVEAAAVAERAVGAGQGLDSIAYVTVGTGIGAGVLIDGEVFRGRDHLEVGHIPVRRNPNDDFAGTCPFHSDCLEGMACGPAIQQRWGTNPSALTDVDEVWELEADYLAQLATVLVYAFSPDKILFSGGVGARDHLVTRIAEATNRQLGGYSVSHPDNPHLVAMAELGNDAGLIGAALLARSVAPAT